MDERDYKAMNAEIKNQTAVEYIEEIIYGDKEFSLSEAFAKAKEMEKEQLNRAYNSDRPNLLCFEKNTAFKEYYKETFKSK